MRTRWIVLLLCVIASSITLAGQTAELRLVSTAWSPFTNEPGEARLALDLVHEALARIGIAAETVIVDEADFTPLLLGGEFDGSAAAWRDEERERTLLYSEPYLENRLILVGRRDSDVSASSLSGLAGRRIALVGGYAYGEAVEASNGPVYVRTSSEEDSVARLLRDEVDYTLMDELVVQNLVRNYGEEAATRLRFGSAPLIARSLHLAVRRDLPDAESIVSRFNAELRGMIADRSYHTLLDVEWIRADVDGDGLIESVPREDQAGPNPPVVVYDLFATTDSTPETETPNRYFVDGSVYDTWAGVPNRYKVRNLSRPETDPAPPLFLFRFGL